MKHASSNWRYDLEAEEAHALGKVGFRCAVVPRAVAGRTSPSWRTNPVGFEVLPYKVADANEIAALGIRR